MAKRLYFVAGEASGDEHGAALMRALRELGPDCAFSGRGGPQMKQLAGASFNDWIDDAAVVGLWEVVKHYGYFRDQFAKALNEIDAAKPDAVVLIDYPGFNLRLARTLRQRSPRLKIIYYISPQVWAWNRGRIRQMARHLDLMLCIFPFEAELYNLSGLRTIFVGHPMIENLARRRTGESRDPNLIGLFPGSRSREVNKIFPVMLKAIGEIVAQRPATRFEVAAASKTLAREIERLLARSGQQERGHVVTGDSSGTMERAFAGMVASGTATLEAAYFRLPFVLVYKVSWPTYFAARLLMRTPFLGMPNVLAGREIVPEFLQHEARPQPVAESVLRLTNNPAEREQMIAEFDAIIEKLGETGASSKAARAIMGEV
ncbi:MAG TPA: lipid-A-disaccharide synthase [Chthoniobacterales bacterium]|nr:lipid-A-disaccharide synthase [Chthoniobacterales bacterium]